MEEIKINHCERKFEKQTIPINLIIPYNTGNTEPRHPPSIK